MNAAEMKQLSEQSEKKEQEKELQKTISDIQERASIGYNFRTFKGFRFEQTADKLKELGYQIKVVPDSSCLFAYLPGYTEVSW